MAGSCWRSPSSSPYEPGGTLELLMDVEPDRPDNRLYITTSRQNMTPEQLRRYPLSGSVFGVRPGPRGLPEPLFAG